MNTGIATLLLMWLSLLAVKQTQAKALTGDITKQDDVDILSSETANAESGTKHKRSYYSPNRNYVSLLDASQVWRPATYTISRPYIIPVFSISNRYPIFYPPQSVYSNPGSPVDNPLNPPYQAPEYLPPKTTSTPDLGERFGSDDDVPPPVWGPAGTVGIPLNTNFDKESEVVPTRAPRPQQSPSRPPLVHGIQRVSTTSSTTTTTTPPPPPPRAGSGPSNCVWAIVSCCSASSPKDYSASCFEQRGCPGPFWGSSPCEGDFARAAIAAAVKYYGTNGK